MVYNLLFLKTYSIPESVNCSLKKHKKHVFSVIKSPHVHKTAQDQFSFKTYISYKKFTLENYKRFIISLKKLKKNSFSDINLKFKYNRSFNKDIKFSSTKTPNFIRLKSSLGVNYLKTLDFKGEEFLNKNRI